MSEWRVYFPEDGETAADARSVPVYHWKRIQSADHAADLACEMDFHDRDGWERMESEFPIVIIDPDGAEHKYVGWHEPSVDHNTRAARND